MLSTSYCSHFMDTDHQIAPEATGLHVLVVDEDEAARSACVEIARDLGHRARGVEALNPVISTMERATTDIVLISIPRRGHGSLEAVTELHTLFPLISIIAMAPVDSAAMALSALHHGAADYLNKPFTMDELASALQRAVVGRQVNSDSRRIRERLRLEPGMGQMIGRSPQMEKLYRILAKVAQSTHPVLILGESGTGKELVARTIHSFGPNAEKPFLPVDCGSLVPTLVESELFGYVKGAFTGANHSKDGLLVSAGNGTVFLDEIGELTLDLQAKLLRALQEKEVRPVGSTQRIPIKARILTATNRDLGAMVDRGAFRKDLYYRLNVVNLRLPSLRDRKDDIPLLVAHFLNKVHRTHPGRFTIHDDALRVMMQYDWPGNVRELENAVERGVTMTSGGEIQLGNLPSPLRNLALARLHEAKPVKATDARGAVKVIPLAVQEREAIYETLKLTGGDKLRAAELLGIGKTTLYRKLKEYEALDLRRTN
ncbi:sigma-54-dependent transcriptional regulator [Occallatibacter savannae]|uniref:sigma-54-dependent transcriptional regulator n=1 Tax=Occallatibacter savannae TaxID=1002691 RepID=UPI001EF5E72B|nr:sigma-54 dependent transcriptional regulator [Occallatibacter savannae]